MASTPPAAMGQLAGGSDLEGEEMGGDGVAEVGAAAAGTSHAQLREDDGDFRHTMRRSVTASLR